MSIYLHSAQFLGCNACKSHRGLWRRDLRLLVQQSNCTFLSPVTRPPALCSTQLSCFLGQHLWISGMLCCLRSLWTGSGLSRAKLCWGHRIFSLSDIYLLGWLRKPRAEVFWQQWAFYHHCRKLRIYSGSPGTIANITKKVLLLGFQTVRQCKVECDLLDGWIFLTATKQVWKIPVFVGRILREKVLLGHSLHS